MLLLLRGAPGAGKTTLAKKLEQLGFVTVSPDDFMFESSNEFDSKKFPACAAKARHKVKTALSEGKNVAVHQTMTREFEVQPYLDLAKELKTEVFSLVVENRHGFKHPRGMSKQDIQRYKDRFSIKL